MSLSSRTNSKTASISSFGALLTSSVLIAQLRRKLGPPPVLHTVRGVGHLLR
ncbi:hypothetical protein AB0C29_37030 [Actinoplanes sp. NPDC048791]|uniref:hypothetical protein n=1 Tax=Actinoplanes sp. NPDC048791 TaxID=3154623 RepID=UPI0033D143E0